MMNSQPQWCVNQTPESQALGHVRHVRHGGPGGGGFYPPNVITSSQPNPHSHSHFHMSGSQNIWSQNTAYSLDMGINDSNKENTGAYWPTQPQKSSSKKSFADLFQSLPPSSGGGDVTPQNVRRHTMRQREDMARTSYLAKKFQRDLSQGHQQPPSKMQPPVRLESDLVLHEMNSRIQTVTKMLMNVNSNLTDFSSKFSEDMRDMKDVLRNLKKDSVNSLWSREPESYLNLELESSRQRRMHDSNGDSKHRGGDKRPCEDSEKKNAKEEEKALSVGRAPAKASSKREEVVQLNETFSEESKSESEDEIEECDFADDLSQDGMQHCIRKRISRFLDSQHNSV